MTDKIRHSSRYKAVVAILACICFILFNGLLSAKKGEKKSPHFNHTPYLTPDRDVKPILPSWPGELVNMYDTVTVSFIGDVMQHGYQIRSALIKGKDPNIASSYDYTQTFKYLEQEFHKDDITVANIEFPIGTPPYSGYPQFSAPESIVTQAVKSGIDLFQIANNHLLDRGKEGFTRTLKIYDSLDVHYTGAYLNDSLKKISDPKIIEIKGVKIAFINFTYGTNGIPIPSPCCINTMDSTQVKLSIQRANECGADIIIALPHWGNEYEIYPSTQQNKWAKMLFNNGVKVIIGTHPHVPQSAELHLNNTSHPRRYGAIDKMVFYSLGNYISNQSNPDYTQLGMLVKVKIIKNNLSGEITLSTPEYEYLWCFKKGEFETDYTVIPVRRMLQDPLLKEKIKDRKQLERMENTFNQIMNKNLVKELYP